jgi:hypothetical protein
VDRALDHDRAAGDDIDARLHPRDLVAQAEGAMRRV